MKNSTIGTYSVIALGAVTLAVVLFSRRAAVEAVYPMERASLVLKRSVWPRVKGIFNGPSCAAENLRLRREVATLSMLSGELERLERENASLRRTLEYSAREPEKWIAAPILAEHAGAFGCDGLLRVGRGTADGVAEGAVVASPEGLVGLVTAVTPHTAVITLVTDPTLKVACSIELGSGRTASGILEGGDDGSLAINHIRGMSVDMPRARVMTSGRGGVFPKGLEVGTLAGAEAGESGEWSGTVYPAVDFDMLEDVFIRK